MGQDPYRFFRIEAAELSDELSRGVLALESDPKPEVVAKLLRAAHTLKGAARVVKQRGIAERAHALEDLLAPIRDKSDPLPRELVEGLLGNVDAIGALVRELSTPAPAAPSIQQKREAPEDAVPSPAEDSEFDALVEGVSEVSVQLRTVRAAAATLERMHHLAALLTDQMDVSLPSETAHGNRSNALAKARSIAAELEDLSIRAERAISGSIDQTERELGEVKGVAERLRLVPANALRSALERTARDAALELGKRVRFTLSGGEVRLDAHLISQIRGALVQAVRNAVAHGIELPHERLQRGKPDEGNVQVLVTRRGTRVAFECRDDGRGIDLEAIRRAAQQNGALPREGPPADARTLLGLLLRGGITTARTVTETSGRAIGLDVARETAARLKGEASLKTEAGSGTTLEIVVPPSLSSFDVLLVEVQGALLSIPLESVSGALRLTASDVLRTSSGESIAHEGGVIPFHPLARSVSRKETVRSVAFPAVVIRGTAGRAAIGVDRVVRTDSVVVRGLPDLAPTDPVVLGASLDVHGRPQLVLDPEALVTAALGVREVLPALAPEVQLPLLVVDDSLTTRMLERSILESAGYEVDIAASAEEALDKIAQRRYGLFLVDVEMPGMSGFDFVARTRARPDEVSTPAILVSSRNSAEDLNRGREVGASAYVIKAEFDQRKLLDTIRGLVTG